MQKGHLGRIAMINAGNHEIFFLFIRVWHFCEVEPQLFIRLVSV